MNMISPPLVQFYFVLMVCQFDRQTIDKRSQFEKDAKNRTENLKPIFEQVQAKWSIPHAKSHSDENRVLYTHTRIQPNYLLATNLWWRTFTHTVLNKLIKSHRLCILHESAWHNQNILISSWIELILWFFGR